MNDNIQQSFHVPAYGQMTVARVHGTVSEAHYFSESHTSGYVWDGRGSIDTDVVNKCQAIIEVGEGRTTSVQLFGNVGLRSGTPVVLQYAGSGDSMYLTSINNRETKQVIWQNGVGAVRGDPGLKGFVLWPLFGFAVLVLIVKFFELERTMGALFPVYGEFVIGAILFVAFLPLSLRPWRRYWAVTKILRENAGLAG